MPTPPDRAGPTLTSHSPRRSAPTSYRLQVDGHLDDHWSPGFGHLTISQNDDGTTSLTGAVADQAELHGVLSKLRDLGVTLISVAVVDQPRP
jgi:hypothetical protein